MLLQLISIVVPVFGAIAVGFAWARLERPFDVATVTNLVMYVGTPCLLISTLDQVRPSAQAFGAMALATLLCYLAMAVLALAVLKLTGLDRRSFLPAMLFPNTGNMGLSLSLFTFGDAGLALAIVTFAMTATGHFTVGAAISRGSLEPKGLLRMPLIYALLVGLAMVFLDLTLPLPLGRGLKLLGGLTIPLMLIALGVSLSRLRPRRLPVAFGLALVRIVGGCAIALAVSALLGLPPLARGALVMQYSMPVAVYAYLFAMRFDRNPDEVAGLVVASTALSLVTVPLTIWLFL
ncbi:hypothetical protein SAMN06265365_10872 [Tistlia consotensis]|uniref:Transporter n=1 Tax=Tistlia consotensis USBA 355 TaxID=560819 RepID=A0A1Y6BWM1_9PROT|nr:AEC family transporter [Tistlia consotensis]SMF24904.1 hypothetical protein SAMN05428998_108108 [Tistlia consotensis USBA 355]SNR60303.1 hypothetical protein SAMN06265365_10872 [Tistlia consotensis]